MKSLVENVNYKIIYGILYIYEGVKHIPEKSFYNNKDIKSIIFPSTLISIGKGAFENCSNISGTLFIPPTVKYISDNAFDSCNIDNLTIGFNVEYIGAYAFCRNKIETISNRSTKLKLIDNFAFSENSELLKDISFNNKYVYINSKAFDDMSIIDKHSDECRSINLYNNYNSQKYICDYKNMDKYTFIGGVLKIHDGVEIVGNFSEFKGIQYCTRVEFPDSVLFILDSAFYKSPSIKEVKLPNNLLFIGPYAFKGCSLRKEKLVLPKSLCSLCYNSFSQNFGENKISMYENATFYGVGGSTEANEMFEFIEDNETEIKITANDKVYNIRELLEQDKSKLEELNLLPETIYKNKKICDNISANQSNAVKSAIVNFVEDSCYQESKSLDNLKSLVSTRMADLTNIHETINILFEKKQLKTIYLLMSYGYDFTSNCMISKAIIYDMTEMIEILLILGAYINEIGNIAMTPLSLACQKGNIDLVRYLIEKGAAINMIDSYNKTAIDYAAENNYQEIVNLINSYDKSESEVEKDLRLIQRPLNA